MLRWKSWGYGPHIGPSGGRGITVGAAREEVGTPREEIDDVVTGGGAGAEVGDGAVGVDTRDEGGGEGAGARKDDVFIPSRLPPRPFPRLPEVLRPPLPGGVPSMELDLLAATWDEVGMGKKMWRRAGEMEMQWAGAGRIRKLAGRLQWSALVE